MATKYYGINDKWTDDDIENVIEVASEDGSVNSVKVNGEDYGGGGGGDSFQLVDVTVINTKASTQSLNSVIAWQTIGVVGEGLAQGLSVSANQTINAKLLTGRYFSSESITLSGDITKANFVLTITGPGTITF